MGKQLVSLEGVPIVNILELVHCLAPVVPLDDDDTDAMADLSFNGVRLAYQGGTDVLWDSQTPVVRGTPASFVFVDEDGNQLLQHQIKVIDDD